MKPIRNLKLVMATLALVAWSGVAFCGEVHNAAKAGDVKTIEALLREKPELLDAEDESGKFPLEVALMNGRKEAVTLLRSDGCKQMHEDPKVILDLIADAQKNHRVDIRQPPAPLKVAAQPGVLKDGKPWEGAFYFGSFKHDLHIEIYEEGVCHGASVTWDRYPQLRKGEYRFIKGARVEATPSK
jgi:hypothetical protein